MKTRRKVSSLKEAEVSEAVFITRDGDFEIEGHAFKIPERFSTRQVLSYRSLIAPVPDRSRGTTLKVEQRVATETYLFRRAAACVIPGFELNAPKTLSRSQLQSIHLWIGRHRPALLSDDRTPRHSPR